jgi:hypothetical protein
MDKFTSTLPSTKKQLAVNRSTRDRVHVYAQLPRAINNVTETDMHLARSLKHMRRRAAVWRL